MIIDLANVGNAVKAVEVVFDPTEIDLDGELVSLNGTARFCGETEKVGSRATLRGAIDADVVFECTRCLEPVARRLAIPFQDVFVGSDTDITASEKEVGDEDLDVSFLQDGNIDMAEVVREQLLLAVPEQIFCRDDCRGLCPKCGSNLNLIDCKCSNDDIDPRWAALKSLK